MRRRTIKYFPCLCASVFLAILTLSGPLCSAQDASSGQIVGNLSDPSGAMVPNVQVTVKNNDTGQTTTVPANSLGHFVAPLLPPGNYSVSVSATGFVPVVKGPIVVPAGTSTTVNVQLTIGTTQQAITVEAGAEILQT